MSFLNPLFLLGLTLAGVPLVLHLFTRRKYTDAPIPSLMFLDQTRRRSLRSFSMHNLPALLLRMAGVACLAMAFAAPLSRMALPWGCESRAPAEVFLIVDDSLSARGRHKGAETFERVREAARQVAAHAAAKDILHVGFLCDAAAPGGAGAVAKKEALEIIGKREPGLCALDARAGVRKALREIAAAAAGAAEIKIAVVGDGQARAFRFEPMRKPPRPASLLIVDASGGARGRNAAITLSEPPGRASAGQPVPLCFNVEGGFPDEAAVSLSLDGEPRGERSVAREGRGRGRACFHVAFSDPGVHYGHASLTPDALEEDNSRFFIVRVAGVARTALAAGREEAENPARDAFYLTRAFRASAAAGPAFQSVRAKLVPPASLEYSRKKTDVIILPSSTPLTQEALSGLAGFVRAGGGLLVFAAGDTPEAADVAETLFDGKIRFAAAKANDGARDEGKSFERAVEIDGAHGIFTAAPGAASGLREARFSSGAGVETLSAELRAPARLGNGRALIVERRIGEGRVILFADGINPYRGSLSLQPAFVPFIYGVCAWLGRAPMFPASEFETARPLKIAGMEGKRSVALTRLEPSPAEIKLAAAGGGAFAAESGKPVAPGVWRIDGGGEGSDLIAVNVNPGEGRLETATDREITSRFPGFSVRVFRVSGADWRERLTAAVYSREYTALFPIFLLGAFAAFFLEALVANRS